MNTSQRIQVRPGFLVGIGLTILVLIVYSQVDRFAFITYDDPQYITENRMVQQGLTLEGLRWAFVTLRASNWHPLTWLSHMLDVELYGLNAGSHHMTNVVLHLLNCLLLFGMLRHTTNNFWPSALVAAFFAVHPLHVESVAWVAERKDVLSTFLGLLCLWSYCHYAATAKKSAYLAALLLFALGLMAKPMLVTLPFLFLLLDVWPLGRLALSDQGGGWSLAIPWRELGKRIVEKTPFFLLTAISCAVTLFAQHHKAMTSLAQLPLGARLMNAAASYLLYIAKLFWPTGMAVLYPYRQPSWTLTLLAICALLLIAMAVWHMAGRRPYLLVGWLWYLGTLVPVIGLVQAGAQSMADRYMYLPAIGLYLMVAWSAAGALARWPRLQWPFFMMSLAVLAVWVAIAHRQTGHWRDSATLYRHALAVTGPNAIIHNNLGIVLRDEKGKLSESIGHFQAAVALDPRNPRHLGNLALAFWQSGEGGKAIILLEDALASYPKGEKMLFYNLATVLVLQQRYTEALEKLKLAVAIDPRYAEAHNLMGVALIRGGDRKAAVGQFRKALSIDPANAFALGNLMKLDKRNKEDASPGFRSPAIPALPPKP